MPPVRLQLGQEVERQVWESIPCISIDRNFQLDIGFVDIQPPSANPVEATDAKVKEVDAYWYFQPGPPVSIHFALCSTLPITESSFRVCVMTILRIVSVIQLIANNSDFTYSVVDDALWSTLESTLGIITACLPVLGPVLEKTKSIVTRTEKSTKSHDRKLRSDSISAIPLKSWSKDSESNSKNFQRLYEHLDTGPDHFDGTGRPGNSSTVITVTTDLDVQSREQ